VEDGASCMGPWDWDRFGEVEDVAECIDAERRRFLDCVWFGSFSLAVEEGVGEGRPVIVVKNECSLLTREVRLKGRETRPTRLRVLR
jgi:hypothetical protein